MARGLQSALSSLDALLKAEGFAPLALSPRIEPGAVFVADDQLVQFPGPHRTLHEDRWVIVVATPEECASLSQPRVRVVPCTSKVDRPGFGDVRIAASDAGFTKESLALLRFNQRIVKAALREYRGSLSPLMFASVLGAVGQYPGLESG